MCQVGHIKTGQIDHMLLINFPVFTAKNVFIINLIN